MLGENLPRQYVDAVPLKDDIIAKIDDLTGKLDVLVSGIKGQLDAIRETTGIGNSNVEQLVSTTKEAAASVVKATTVDQSTLDQVVAVNQIGLEAVKNKAAELKSQLQRGVENMDEAFVQNNRSMINRMLLAKDYPVSYIKDRTINLEDHLRDKVRRKFGGNLPFCDEDEVIDPTTGKKSFVKKTDVDPATGRKRASIQAELLKRRTATEKPLIGNR